jgi:ABC-type sugar transport system, ATPase component
MSGKGPSVAIHAQDLALAYGESVAARDLSFVVRAGEAVSFLGLGPVGQQAVVDFLRGGCRRISGSISVLGSPLSGDRIRDPEGFGIFRPVPLARNRYEVSLLEELFLFRPGGFDRLWWSQSRRAAEAEALFARVGLDRSVSDDVQSLSPVEYARLQLAKALDLGAGIVLLYDDMLSLSLGDLRALESLLSELKEVEGLAFIVHSDTPARSYSFLDTVFAFRDERLVKKLEARDCDEASLARYLEEKEPEAAPALRKPGGSGQLLRVNSLSVPGIEPICFAVEGGSSLNLVHYDLELRDELFGRLSGSVADGELELSVGESRIAPLSVGALLRRRVAIVGSLTDPRDLLEKLPVEDNLALPILKKTRAAGLFYDGAVGEALYRQLKARDPELPRACADCGPAQVVEICLERWIAFRPTALLMLDPLEHQDDRCKALIRSYIRRFLGLGTAVAIVSSSKRHYAELCDRCIQAQSDGSGDGER